MLVSEFHVFFWLAAVTRTTHFNLILEAHPVRADSVHMNELVNMGGGVLQIFL